MTYDDITQAVLGYYSSTSNIYQQIQLGTASAADVYAAYSRIPNMRVDYTGSGRTLGWSYAYKEPLANSDVQSILDSVGDSNYGGGYYGGGNNLSVSYPVDTSGTPGNYQVTGATSGGSMLSTIVDRACLAVTGASLGCKLGMAIDSALYNLNPNWWNENYPTINPQTWPSIVGQDETGQYFFRTLFGIQQNGTTAYMSAEALAQTYMLLRDKGALEDPTYDVDTYTPKNNNWIIGTNVYRFPVIFGGRTSYVLSEPSRPYIWDDYADGTGTILSFTFKKGDYTYRPIFVSDASFTHYQRSYYADQTPPNYNTVSVSNITIDGHRYYYSGGGTGKRDITYTSNEINIVTGTPFGSDVVKIAFNQPITPTPAVPGITKQPSATVPSPTVVTGTTVSDVINQLKQNYPNLFTGSITESVMQDDGTIEEVEYVPVPYPDDITLTQTQPTTGTKTQTDLIVEDETLVDVVTDTTQDRDNDPPDTGTGNAPAPVIPTGNASSLWAIYNPTQAELNSFGSWLWSSNFVDQLKKLFNDPMQAIIGVHKVFASPSTSGTATIKCGYLDSGVSAAVVSSQYTSVDCGTVSLLEYFGNVFDYDPFTKVSIYLPFIGVVSLKTSEVMRSSINVVYGVDVITGACLAKVKITRDGAGGILYSYGGSCACHYPVSSGSYAGIISGIVTSAMGVAAGIATGSPLTGAAGVISGIRQMKTDISHSGGFTGCAGAMGPKKPYLIITRPQTRVAENFDTFSGLPSNSYVQIGDCSGFIKVSDCRIISQTAYDTELAEIEMLLKTGILNNNGGV